MCFYVSGKIQLWKVTTHIFVGTVRWCLRAYTKSDAWETKENVNVFLCLWKKISSERLLPIFSWGLWDEACMFAPYLRLAAPYQPIISRWSRSIDEYYKNSLAKELLGGLLGIILFQEYRHWDIAYFHLCWTEYEQVVYLFLWSKYYEIHFK